MIAEGGTGHDHAVTIARSDTLTGPYEPNPRNPILTHRHLGRDYPIVGTGHADLVETQYGEWWMVALGMRPYDGYFYNLGRETFLAPVRWEDGWPVVSPGRGRIEAEGTVPNLPECTWPSHPTCDHFEHAVLGLEWNFLRTPREPFWSLTERPGHLRLHLRPERITERVNPSFVGRRQQHKSFAARTALDFDPVAPHECAGLVLLQNDRFHLRFVCTLDEAGQRLVRATKCFNGNESVLGQVVVGPGQLYLKVEARGQDYGFYVAAEPEAWRPVAERAWTDGCSARRWQAASPAPTSECMPAATASPARMLPTSTGSSIWASKRLGDKRHRPPRRPVLRPPTESPGGFGSD